MLINPDEINKLLSITKSEISYRGKKYFERSKVKAISFDYNLDTDYEAISNVEGTYIYTVKIKKNNRNITFNCDCPYSKQQSDPCKHVVATLFNMYINSDEYFKLCNKSEKIDINKLLDTEYKKSKDGEKFEANIIKNNLIEYYENLEFQNFYSNAQKINLVPCFELFSFRGANLKVKFKIGKDRLYILKDVFQFAENIKNKENFQYGKNLKFVHKIDNFSEDSKELAKFIYNFGMQYNCFNNISKYGFSIEKEFRSSIDLKYSMLDEFFNIAKKITSGIAVEGYLPKYPLIKLVEDDPIFKFEIVDNENIGLNIINFEKGKYHIFEGQETIYILYKDKLHKCSKEFKESLYPLLKDFENKRTDCIKFDEKYATSLCEYLIPKISKKSEIKIDEKIREKYRAEKLATKIYLDINEASDIVANVKFCYDDIEFNPFDKNISVFKNRNKISESKVMSLFKEYNFLIDEKKANIFLSSEDDIYRFLVEGINIFMQKFEVLVTDKLKNRQIINTKNINIGVRLKNDLLSLDFENLDLSESDLKEIFKRYKVKRKYYRLKDGSFINLESSGIDTLSKLNENLGISEKDIASKKIQLPKYRAIYLDNLSKQDDNINWKKEAKFKEIIKDIKEVADADFKLPNNLNASLRSYQKTGYNWLKTLDKYGFGGILADDMGLGKTLQIIAILQSEKQKYNKKINIKEENLLHTSIVVCPSSLYINWKKEINKFAPELKILIVSGSASVREELIKQSCNYDVVITSYDLLKRDIDFYEKIEFRYAIADEAQYIKNNNTQNAKSLKKLNAVTRFALTGTPIENSLAELWSIFDFVMPGYLFSYKKFKENYELPIIKDSDENTTLRLQKLVAPFILRRIKKEVLKELPDKTESIMYSQMEEKQEKLYLSYLNKAKEEIKQEFDTNGFEKSRIKILSVITRLRQLCCHPSLFIENYDGNSSKLEQCIQIIKDAISSNHKILLFSGFTSMLDIIAKELKKNGIEYDMLTGNTKVDTRVQMVDEFNNSNNIKVFLISLKAGGTGLNLIGADMVIHYDPWWNLSAQNQATDRAYRIGQKNNVQVFKLIAQNSIEEKIITLQNKKIDLTNSIISEKETFINKMSKEEILDLFDI